MRRTVFGRAFSWHCVPLLWPACPQPSTTSLLFTQALVGVLREGGRGEGPRDGGCSRCASLCLPR